MGIIKCHPTLFGNVVQSTGLGDAVGVVFSICLVVHQVVQKWLTEWTIYHDQRARLPLDSNLGSVNQIVAQRSAFHRVALEQIRVLLQQKK